MYSLQFLLPSIISIKSNKSFLRNEPLDVCVSYISMKAESSYSQCKEEKCSSKLNDVNIDRIGIAMELLDCLFFTAHAMK